VRHFHIHCNLYFNQKISYNLLYYEKTIIRYILAKLDERLHSHHSGKILILVSAQISRIAAYLKRAIWFIVSFLLTYFLLLLEKL